MSTISFMEVPDSLPFEPYVDVVADHLSSKRRQVLRLTREGKLPADPDPPLLGARQQDQRWTDQKGKVESIARSGPDVSGPGHCERVEAGNDVREGS